MIPGRAIPGGLAAVLAGHIHRHQILTRDLAGRRLASPVLYPGSTERTSYAERTETKGYLRLRVAPGRGGGRDTGGHVAGWRFVPLPTPPLPQRHDEILPASPSVLRVDLDGKSVVASVRDLIAPPDDVPRPASALAVARAEIGTAVHRDWRAEMEGAQEGFRAEASVALSHEVDGFDTTLRGRADGVWPDADGSLVVAEVKSIGANAAGLRRLGPADLADARLQVRLYALCLARLHPDATLRPRLVLVSVVDGTRRDVDVPFDASSVLTSFRDPGAPPRRRRTRGPAPCRNARRAG